MARAAVDTKEVVPSSLVVKLKPAQSVPCCEVPVIAFPMSRDRRVGVLECALIIEQAVKGP